MSGMCMENKVINAAIEYLKELFENEYSGHDYFHTMRVYKMATQIAIKEQADIEVVQLAALLHDVDDIKLFPDTHEKKEHAVQFLKHQDIEDEKISLIIQIINEISFSGSDSVIPETLEGKCTQDADRLDAIGAIGIARAFAYGGNHQRIMYDPDVEPLLNMSKEEYHKHISTTLNHFYEKLFLLKDMMNTKTAKEIAEKRDIYMREYVEEFLEEWDGWK